MDRREFLRMSTLLGLSIPAAYAIVGKVTGKEFITPAKAAMPRGGKLRLQHRVADVSNAHTVIELRWGDQVMPVCPRLTRVLADGTTRPDLCTSWEPSDDLRADPRTCDSSTRGWRCQTPEHDADHGETDEGDNGSGITLEVASEAPVAADPGERSLHDPAFRQGHEAVRVGALNDFQLPAAGRGDGRRHPRPLVAAVGEDGLDEGERTARGSKQLAGAVAILRVGGMDDDAQQQAECIDEDVALAPRDLLARIEALRVERSPPFCAPLALWLSITAADGLTSRPSRSRTAT